MDIIKEVSLLMKADDLEGQRKEDTIDSVAMEEVAPGERKPVMRFVGGSQGLVLNKTNARTIASAYGRETTAWIGRQITLFATTVPFQGRMVPAIRVAVPSPGQPAASPQPTPASPAPVGAQPQAAAMSVPDSNSW